MIEGFGPEFGELVGKAVIVPQKKTYEGVYKVDDVIMWLDKFLFDVDRS